MVNYAFATPKIHALALSNRSEDNRQVMEQYMDTEIRHQIQRGSESDWDCRVEATAELRLYAFHTPIFLGTAASK